MTQIRFLVVILLIIAVSLVGGILFSFVIAVNPGLKNLADAEFIRAMKSINKEILNSLFYLCFFSPPALFVMVIYLQDNSLLLRRLMMAAFVLYLFMIVITATINVPLNQLLDAFDSKTSTAAELSKMRLLFEGKWVFWNKIRTALAVASLIILVSAQINFSVLKSVNQG